MNYLIKFKKFIKLRVKCNVNKLKEDFINRDDIFNEYNEWIKSKLNRIDLKF